MDTSSWTPVGSTTNTDFFLAEPRILVAVIREGTRDTPTTAQENIDFYTAYFREHGRGALIYVIGPLLDQTRDARHMYKDQEDPSLVYGVALIVESLLARAIASFFLGIAKPAQVPLEAFRSYDEGLSWVRGKLADEPEAGPSSK